MAKNDEAARREMKAARRALDEEAARARRARNREETDEYLRLNNRVIQAEKNVSWWRR
jgi:hypothetical protein